MLLVETTPNRILKPTKKFAQTFNLDFCPKFGYYTGNAYRNNIGETLPNYFYYNSEIYMLKYVSGCFNPFLYKMNRTNYIVLLDTKTKQYQCISVAHLNEYQKQTVYDNYKEKYKNTTIEVR